jgi:hypothetical protein
MVRFLKKPIKLVAGFGSAQANHIYKRTRISTLGQVAWPPPERRARRSFPETEPGRRSGGRAGGQSTDGMLADIVHRVATLEVNGV